MVAYYYPVFPLVSKAAFKLSDPSPCITVRFPFSLKQVESVTNYGNDGINLRNTALKMRGIAHKIVVTWKQVLEMQISRKKYWNFDEN